MPAAFLLTMVLISKPRWPMFDLLIRNANLPDGRSGMDIAITAGRIVDVAPAIQGDARETIDATGRLVSPPFVDPHFHMDATLSLGLRHDGA